MCTPQKGGQPQLWWSKVGILAQNCCWPLSHVWSFVVYWSMCHLFFSYSFEVWPEWCLLPFGSHCIVTRMSHIGLLTGCVQVVGGNGRATCASKFGLEGMCLRWEPECHAYLALASALRVQCFTVWWEALNIYTGLIAGEEPVVWFCLWHPVGLLIF